MIQVLAGGGNVLGKPFMITITIEVTIGNVRAREDITANSSSDTILDNDDNAKTQNEINHSAAGCFGVKSPIRLCVQYAIDNEFVVRIL